MHGHDQTNGVNAISNVKASHSMGDVYDEGE